MLGSETFHSVITRSKNSGEVGVVQGTRANKSSKCPTDDSQGWWSEASHTPGCYHRGMLHLRHPSCSCRCCPTLGGTSPPPCSPRRGTACTPSVSRWGWCGGSPPSAWSTSRTPGSRTCGSGGGARSQWTWQSSAGTARRCCPGSRWRRSRRLVAGWRPAAGSPGSSRCWPSRTASHRKWTPTRRKTWPACGSATGCAWRHRPPCPAAGCPLERQWGQNLVRHFQDLYTSVEIPASHFIHSFIYHLFIHPSNHPFSIRFFLQSGLWGNLLHILFRICEFVCKEYACNMALMSKTLIDLRTYKWEPLQG